MSPMDIMGKNVNFPGSRIRQMQEGMNSPRAAATSNLEAYFEAQRNKRFMSPRPSRNYGAATSLNERAHREAMDLEDEENGYHLAIGKQRLSPRKIDLEHATRIEQY